MSQPLKPLKWYKKLHSRKGRIEHGVFLVEGSRAVAQITKNHPSEIVEFIATEELFEYSHKYPFRVVNADQFSSVSSTRTPQGIMAVVRLPEDIYSEKLPDPTGSKILLLEDIQDPGNVGTLIRTAAAFDFAGVILTEKCADPVSPKCVQSSAGTLLSLWIRRTPGYLKLARELSKKGYGLLAADLGGTEPPEEACSQSKIILALGNEASGLSDSILQIADAKVKIPIDHRKAQSLNVAGCGAILMYLASPERK